jgi:hypothetical protein
MSLDLFHFRVAQLSEVPLSFQRVAQLHHRNRVYAKLEVCKVGMQMFLPSDELNNIAEVSNESKEGLMQEPFAQKTTESRIFIKIQRNSESRK